MMWPTLSKTKPETSERSVWVGDTLVKKGTYKVAYDDKTGEVSFNDRKTTVAKATVRAEKRDSARDGWEVVLAAKGARTGVSTERPSESVTRRRSMRGVVAPGW